MAVMNRVMYTFFVSIVIRSMHYPSCVPYRCFRMVIDPFVMEWTTSEGTELHSFFCMGAYLFSSANCSVAPLT